MDELPDLPFQQILSFLSLRDLFQCRAVSRGWYHRINCRKVKSLCCSDYPSGFIQGRSRWLSGAYAKNFISSPRIDRFLDTFASTTLSDLKCLRLCLQAEYMPAFLQALNSFGQLEELDIIRFSRRPSSSPKIDFELNLPMLRSIHFESVYGVERLSLDSPRLKQIKLLCYVSLNLVHKESIERLLLPQLNYAPVKDLKNLQYLHIRWFSEIDSTLLSSLEQLKEIHLYENNDPSKISQLFEQKKRYGRTDLKIYRFGCLLNDPEDPLVSRFQKFYDEGLLVHLAENSTRLADKIPLFRDVYYEDIERVAPGLEVDLLKRFTELNTLQMYKRVENVRSFLDLLKSLDITVALWFYGDQPQDLFDRLPEHSAVQKLVIHRAPSDHRFLLRLKHLVNLHLNFSIDIKSIRQVLQQLRFLLKFDFLYLNKWFQIAISHPKRFEITVDKQQNEFADLNAAIQFIVEKAREEEEGVE